MAKLNIADVDSINDLLETALPFHYVRNYEMVTFKDGKGRFTPKTDLLVVKSYSTDPYDGKVYYTTFLIKRESLCNSIEKLIKQ